MDSFRSIFLSILGLLLFIWTLVSLSVFWMNKPKEWFGVSDTHSQLIGVIMAFAQMYGLWFFFRFFGKQAEKFSSE